MKKVISILMVIVICGCLMCGCREESTVTLEQRHDDLKLSTQMVLLEEFNADNYYRDGLCYDKDTKIIYMYVCTYTHNANYVVSYSPYYVRDMNDNAVIGIYNGDE